MRLRSLLPLVFLIVLAACDETPTATTDAPSSTPPATSAESVEVSYSLDGASTYAVDLRRDVRLSSETGALLDRLPGSADVTVTATGRVSLEVIGSRGGGAEVQAAVSWDEVVVEGAVDGEPAGDEPSIDGLGDLLDTEEELGVTRSGVVEAGEASGRFDLLSDALFGWSGLFGPLLPEAAVPTEEVWTRSMGRTEVEGRVVLDSPSRYRVSGTTHVEGRQEDLTDFYSEYVAAFGATDSNPSLVVEFGPRIETWEGTVEGGSLVESRASATVATTATVAGSEQGETASVVVNVTDELDVEAVPTRSETTDPVGSAP